MISPNIRKAVLALAMMTPTVAHANAPPPPQPHARYGPLTQCLNGFAITAGASEAILMWEDAMTLMSDAHPVNLSIDRGDPYRSEERMQEVDTPNLGRIMRYQRAYSRSSPKVRTFYLLPGHEGRRATSVNNVSFDGTDQDLSTLGRISRVEGSGDQCGDFAAPNYPGENPDARDWSPEVAWGPRFHCQNGIGFFVSQGEAVQSQWLAHPELGQEPASRVASEDNWFVVFGPIATPTGTRSGRVGESYLVERIDWSGRPALLLRPLESTPRGYPQNERYRDWIRIEFPTHADAKARALVRRIEFVTNDPRCDGS